MSLITLFYFSFFSFCIFLNPTLLNGSDASDVGISADVPSNEISCQPNGGTSGDFDFYLLAQSLAATFCLTHQ